MVLGIHYMTRIKPGDKGEGKYFYNVDELMMAVEIGSVGYNALIKLKVGDELIETCAGRTIFSAAMPDVVGFVNKQLGDKELRALVADTFMTYGPAVAVNMLDSIKDVGFKYATLFGATIGIDDIIIPEKKKGMIDAANNKVLEIQKQYIQGHITQEERYNRTIEVWSKTNEELTNELMKDLKEDRDGFNPVHMMADSGARGSRAQIRQLAGMRGLMAKPSGDIIELPIRSNFKEGLSVIEFFISTNGARKGLADTALKTADAGYLTRRLVDIAQDVVINVEDCGTINGIDISALKDGEEIVESLADRIEGRFTLERVKHPITGEIIIDVNEEVSSEVAQMIEAFGVERVRIRTVLTCEAEHGVCRKCYGRNLASGSTVNIGEAVGIIAAQSIGQPGTQLTMRTFHIGGAATKMSEENRTAVGYPVIIKEIHGNTVTLDNGDVLFTRKGFLVVAKVIRVIELEKGDEIVAVHGQKLSGGEVLARRGKEDILAKEVAFVFLPSDEKRIVLITQDQKLDIRNGAELLAKEEEIIPANESIATFDPFSEPIIAEVDGKIRFEDIVQGTTLKEEINEDTGNTEKKITEFSLETLQPRIVLEDENGKDLAVYHLPGNSFLNVEDGETVRQGRALAKLLKDSVKTTDITGGLPRVGELFEARRPKSPAVLAQITGTVVFKNVVKGKRVVEVQDNYGKTFKHLVPMGKHMFVRDGDLVQAGEALCEGATDPHDILEILGENALQAFMVNEVQEVYRLQGVNINDKHIGVIVRQMMRKVEIVRVGDTNFIYGKQVDKYKFHEENRKVIREGGQSSVAKPLLLGITRASLNIDSFISAASFQETTKVLTNAAIAGSTDNLRGLKENVIIGHLIPAGTGMKNYRNVKLFDENSKDLDASVQTILEQRRLQKEAEREAGQEDVDDEGDGNESYSADQEEV
jgi:DNA-directed RNA polymerase subunit beta'